MSLRGELLVAYFRLVREKRTWNNLRLLEKEMQSSQRPGKTRVPRRLRRRHHVEHFEVDEFPCHTLRRRGGGHGPHVLHLHGGAYVQQISPHHWRFVEDLVDRLDAVVTVPLYPLAPRYDVTRTLPMVRAAYDRTLAGEEPSRRILMGDSAGGGLCVALAQQFRDEGHPQPGRIVLLSPWLDVTMDGPHVEEQDARDPYLGARGLAEAGRRYAGPLKVTDPRVSPLFGSIEGLAPLTVFIGTRDVLLPDSRRLRQQAAEAGVSMDYQEYSGMIHNWPMRRLPEGRRAMDQLTSLLCRPGNDEG